METRCFFLLTEPMKILDWPLSTLEGRSEVRPRKRTPNTRVGLCVDSLKKVVLVPVLRGSSVVPSFVAAAHHGGERDAVLFAEWTIRLTTRAKDQIQQIQRPVTVAVSNFFTELRMRTE